MRELPAKYAGRVHKSLIDIYTNFDRYEDAEYLSSVFEFDVYFVSMEQKAAIFYAEELNTSSNQVVIVSLPYFMGNCYMVIGYNNRIKAAELGLNLIFV